MFSFQYHPLTISSPTRRPFFPEEQRGFVLKQLVTAPSSREGDAAAAVVSKRRVGGARKSVPKLGGGEEEKEVSEAKLERRASSRTNPNQDTTGRTLSSYGNLFERAFEIALKTVKLDLPKNGKCLQLCLIFHSYVNPVQSQEWEKDEAKKVD